MLLVRTSDDECRVRRRLPAAGDRTRDRSRPAAAAGFLTLPLTGLPATDETNNATDWICALLSLLPNAGIPPPPLVT